MTPIYHGLGSSWGQGTTLLSLKAFLNSLFYFAILIKLKDPPPAESNNTNSQHICNELFYLIGQIDSEKLMIDLWEGSAS